MADRTNLAFRSSLALLFILFLLLLFVFPISANFFDIFYDPDASDIDLRLTSRSVVTPSPASSSSSLPPASSSSSLPPSCNQTVLNKADRQIGTILGLIDGVKEDFIKFTCHPLEDVSAFPYRSDVLRVCDVSQSCSSLLPPLQSFEDSDVSKVSEIMWRDMWGLQEVFLDQILYLNGPFVSKLKEIVDELDLLLSRLGSHSCISSPSDATLREFLPKMNIKSQSLSLCSRAISALRECRKGLVYVKRYFQKYWLIEHTPLGQRLRGNEREEGGLVSSLPLDQGALQRKEKDKERSGWRTVRRG